MGEAELDIPVFEALYSAALPRVYNYVCYRLADRQAAEDLTAEIFERALRYWPTYRAERGSLSTWLFQIARSVVINYLRAQHRKPEPISLDRQPAIAADAPTPEQAAILSERMGQVLSAMHSLPEREQEALAMKFGWGLGNQEIAGLMNLRSNHVGVLIYRALHALRQAMEGQTGG